MQVDQRTRITETGLRIPSSIGTIQHGVVSPTRLAESEGGKTHIWLLPLDEGQEEDIQEEGDGDSGGG